MSASLSGVFNVQELADAGLSLVGGQLYTYVSGGTTFKTAYTDAAGTVSQTYTNDGLGGQYIALNARGELPAPLFLAPGAYDLTLKRADGSTVWTRQARGTDDAANAVTTLLGGDTGADQIGYLAPGSNTVRRTIRSRGQDAYSIHDFGLARGGSTLDASTAIIKAIAEQVPIGFDAGTTYMAPKLVVPANGRMDFRSEGPGANLKLSAGISDYLIDNENGVVTLRGINIDGNRQQNNVGSILPAAILNRLGSFYMYGGTIKNALHDAIRSGNVEDGAFVNGQSAVIVHMEDVIIDGGVAADTSLDHVAPQDCYRIFNTQKVRLINCGSLNGLSGARLGYYNGDVRVLGGLYANSFGDCGVTIYLTTRWVCDGVTSIGHFQHGFEIDATNNGVLSNWVAAYNAKNAVLATEYGPPDALAQHAGTYDDVTTVFGTVYPCRGVLIGPGIGRRNGLSGIKTIGQGTGVTIRGAHLEDNNTTGSTTENCAIFTDGGTLNEDGVTISDITAVDTGAGNQKYFRRSSNNQYRTFSAGGHRISGMLHHEFATRGLQTVLARGVLADTARWGGAATTQVPDSLAVPPLSARKIVDASGSGSTVVWCTIPAQPAGDKIIEMMLRTPDTMTSCTVDVSVYQNGSVAGASIFNSAQTLNSAYKMVQVEIPDSIGSRNYDAIRVTFTTDSVLTGSVEIGQLDPYGSWEQ